MNFKTIMVVMDLEPAADSQVKLAQNLSDRLDANLIGTAVVSPDYAAWGGEHPKTIGDRGRDHLDEAHQLFSRLSGASDPNAWFEAIAEVDVLVRHMRDADLIIVGRDQPAEVDAFAFSRGDLVMEAGRPILLIPPGIEHLPGKRILIAWKDTREARRAVQDALPLLARAETVCVLRVDEGGGKFDELGGFSRYLRAHGVNADVRIQPLTLPTASEELIQFALDNDMGMIVAGAYGHSRLREWVFGSVTQGLLEQSRVPVLLSH